MNIRAGRAYCRRIVKFNIDIGSVNVVASLYNVVNSSGVLLSDVNVDDLEGEVEFKGEGGVI